MTHHTIDYARIIREHGHRVTPQRKAIMDIVCELQGHAAIETIYERLHERFPKIDLSTVYRNLDFLSSLHLISSAYIDGKRVFEIAAGSPTHHHLICKRCKQEIEIHDDMLDPAYERIRQAYGFKVEANHLILEGICSNCLGKDDTRP